MGAWARYRPNFAKNNSMFTKKKRKDEGEMGENLLNTFWDKSFLNLMLSEVRLKQYDFEGEGDEIRRKKNFKEKFVQPYKDKVHLEKLEKMKNKKNGEDTESDLDDPINIIPEDEVNLIDDFLSCFIIEGGSKVDMIDIKHAIKSFPGRIYEHNVFRCQG